MRIVFLRPASSSSSFTVQFTMGFFFTWPSSMSSSSSPYYSSLTFSIMVPLGLLYSMLSQRLIKVPVAALPLPPSTTQPKKLAIITGCNTGIGYETAKMLIQVYHYTVILACRDENKARMALVSMGSPTTGIFLVPLDLASFRSVQEFVAAVQTYCCEHDAQQISLLVNNAGRNTSGISIDGYDLQFQTNFIGHFLLTKLLLEQNLLVRGGVREPAGCRVVNLSSVMHHFCGGPATPQMDQVGFWLAAAAARTENMPQFYGIPIDDVVPPVPTSWWERRTKFVASSLSSSSTTTQPIQCYHNGNNTYPLSKLAAILFTNELNRRYYHPDRRLSSLAVNPGAVKSDIWRSLPSFVRWIVEVTCLTTTQGCHTSIAAAMITNDDFDVAWTYLQPYWLPSWSSFRQNDIPSTPPPPPYPLWEMNGPFVGSQFTTPRLPPNAEAAGQALWTACEQILEEWAKKQE